MPALQPVRGTRDIWYEEMRRFRAVIESARELAERYGYLEMSTPVFEFTEVFKRTLGDTSDVVTKEMYTFSPRGEEELTLRPGSDGGRRAGLPERRPRATGAGKGLLSRPDVPLRAAAEGPLPAVSPA